MSEMLETPMDRCKAWIKTMYVIYHIQTLQKYAITSFRISVTELSLNITENKVCE